MTIKFAVEKIRAGLHQIMDRRDQDEINHRLICCVEKRTAGWLTIDTSDRTIGGRWFNTLKAAVAYVERESQ